MSGVKRAVDLDVRAGVEGKFPTTHWTQIFEAQAVQQERGRQALGRLLQRYSGPMLAYLMGRYRVPPEEADDLLQGFIEKRVLEKNLLSKANRERGRFRSFLVVSLDNYVLHEFRDRSCKMRRPEGRLVSLNQPEVQAEVDQAEADHLAFDLEWARRVLDLAAERTAAFYRQAGDERPWHVFVEGVMTPLLEGSRRPTYGQLARRFGLEDTRRVDGWMRMAKRRFGKELRGVLREYVQHAEEVEEELRDLVHI
ncbi:hypothetical protein D6833_10805, partial [Candidatus Parcubacteria bacterium]